MRHVHVQSAVLVCSLSGLFFGCGGDESQDSVGSAQSESTVDSNELTLRDSRARRVNPFENPQARATVLVFTRVDCPISNRYAPEIHRLFDLFTPKGVVFWLVYPGPNTSLAEIRRHLDEFGYPCEGLADPHHVLVNLSGANITPEVAVFDEDLQLVYRGRIDDRFVDFNQARPEPTQRDLKLTLEAIVSGQPLSCTLTSAVGCSISDLK